MSTEHDSKARKLFLRKIRRASLPPGSAAFRRPPGSPGASLSPVAASLRPDADGPPEEAPSPESARFVLRRGPLVAAVVALAAGAMALGGTVVVGGVALERRFAASSPAGDGDHRAAARPSPIIEMAPLPVEAPVVVPPLTEVSATAIATSTATPTAAPTSTSTATSTSTSTSTSTATATATATPTPTPTATATATATATPTPTPTATATATPIPSPRRDGGTH